MLLFMSRHVTPSGLYLFFLLIDGAATLASHLRFHGSGNTINIKGILYSNSATLPHRSRVYRLSQQSRPSIARAISNMPQIPTHYRLGCAHGLSIQVCFTFPN